MISSLKKKAPFGGLGRNDETFRDALSLHVNDVANIYQKFHQKKYFCRKMKMGEKILNFHKEGNQLMMRKEAVKNVDEVNVLLMNILG